jgi:Chaperone of endosialidase
MSQTKAQLISGSAAQDLTLATATVNTGSAGSPSITFSSDVNTGIYSPGADQVAISTNGSGRLFVDASGRVLVGTASGSGNTSIHIQGNSGAAAGNAWIALQRGQTNPGSGLDLGGIGFGDSASSYGASITALSDETWSASAKGGRLVFSTTTAGTTSLTERMRLDSSGRLGVGTSPTAQFHVNSGATGTAALLESTGSGAYLNFKNSSGSSIYIGATGTNFFVETNGSERLRVDSSGRLGLGTSTVPGWHSNYKVAHVGAQPSLSSYVGQSALLTTNAYDDGPGTWKYVGTNYATRYAQDPSNGTHSWATASSGTAGGAVTWNTAMYIDNSNRVGIGTTSPGQALSVAGNILTSSAGTNYVASSSAGTTSTYLITDTSGGNIQVDGSWPIRFTNNSTERARIDSSGRLLVGTSSSATVGDSQFSRLQVQGNTFLSTGNAILNLQRGQAATAFGVNNTLGTVLFSDNAGGEFARIDCQSDAASGTNDYPGRLTFSTTADGASSPTERMRISQDGSISTQKGIAIGSIGASVPSSIYFGGGVIASGAGTSTLKYNTSSGIVTYDASSRLVKENIKDCPYGSAEIQLLKPRKYFRTDDQREEIGFVADELVQVLPEFVAIGPKSVITKNEEDTEDIPLGVNYEKLTAVLTKALQEAIGRIETLEAEVAALKGA